MGCCRLTSTSGPRSWRTSEVKMRRRFVPSTPFSTPVMLMIPTYTKVKGVDTKTFTDEERINCSFKSFGGRYRPDIKSDCRIRVMETGKVYEILGEVENIDMRNQFAKFKVRAVKGGA